MVWIRGRRLGLLGRARWETMCFREKSSVSVFSRVTGFTDSRILVSGHHSCIVLNHLSQMRNTKGLQCCATCYLVISIYHINLIFTTEFVCGFHFTTLRYQHVLKDLLCFAKKKKKCKKIFHFLRWIQQWAKPSVRSSFGNWRINMNERE